MTGHVAQFFVTDESWHAALTALHGAVRAGGRLAFESRNPGAREWEQWTPGACTSVHDPIAGRIDTWSDVRDVRNGVVTYVNHYVFAATGEALVSEGRLRFRSQAELTQSLADAGFAVERIFGDWDRRPAGPTTRELIVVAAARLSRLGADRGSRPQVPGRLPILSEEVCARRADGSPNRPDRSWCEWARGAQCRSLPGTTRPPSTSRPPPRTAPGCRTGMCSSRSAGSRCPTCSKPPSCPRSSRTCCS